MLSFTSVFFIPRRAAAVIFEEFIHNTDDIHEPNRNNQIDYYAKNSG